MLLDLQMGEADEAEDAAATPTPHAPTAPAPPTGEAAQPLATEAADCESAIGSGFEYISSSVGN